MLGTLKALVELIVLAVVTMLNRPNIAWQPEDIDGAQAMHQEIWRKAKAVFSGANLWNLLLLAVLFGLIIAVIYRSRP